MQRTLMSTAVAAGLAGLLTAPTSVFAQDEEDQAASGAIEEITVVARRREESITDVPGTVTALSEQTLQNAGVQRATDFINLTPGVTLVDAAEVGDTQVNIRGINGARDAENSFAFLIDGILYTNPAAFNREYTDLQQIEVFKGPQGAIYGRNAAAGAIIVTTTTPGNEFETSGLVSGAEDSTYLAKAQVSGALVENELYYRLSGDYRSTDGYYRNQFLNGLAEVDSLESYNLNFRLVWEPSESTRLDTKLRVGEVDGNSIMFNSTFNLPVFAAGTNNPAAYQDVNAYTPQFDANIVSDNDQEALEFSTKLDQDLNGMTLTGWFLYSDIENNLIADGTSGAFGFYANDPVCQQTTAELTGYPLLPPQFIGQTPNGVIFDPNGSFFGAYTPTTCDGLQEQLRNQKDYSFELRLASDNDGPVQWMAGVYFLDIDREVGVSTNRDSGAAPIRGLYQPEPGPNSTASLAWDQFDSTVYAAFGQVEWDATDSLELSFALRYDREERKVRNLVDPNARQSFIDLNFDGVFDDPLNPGLLFSPGGLPSKKETFDEWQPRIAARWDVSDSTSLFASYGVGFKAGGFNNSGSAATVNAFINGFICPPDGSDICWSDVIGADLPVIQDDYDEETSDAFELGFNSLLLDGSLRLNGAAYYTEVSDMQFFEFFVGSFGLLRVVSNIDKVEITGVEFGFDYLINDNWRFYGGGNWLDSEIKANRSRPDTIGNESPYTPEYTANLGLEVTYPVWKDWDFFTRVDTRFVGETWFHTVQAGERPTIFMPLFEQGFGPGAGFLGTAEYSVSRRDTYAIADWRLGFRNDNWTVTAFVTNLHDERYQEELIPAPEFGGTFGAPGTLRRYGLEVAFFY